MIEALAGLPEGVIGFRLSGDISGDDYRAVLEPALNAAVEAGEIRFVVAVEDDFEMEGGAVLEDMKTGLKLGVGHHSAWKRTAVVTDKEWIQKAIRLFAWMTPGEVEVFGLDRLEEAKSWAAG